MSRRVIIALLFLVSAAAALPKPEAADSSSSEESGEKQKVQAVKQKSKDSSSSEEEEQGKASTARNDLFLFSVMAIANMSKIGVEKGKPIIKGVLSDLDAVKANNPVLQAKLSNFTAFIDESATLDNDKKGINLPMMKVFVDFCNIVGNYSEDDNESSKNRSTEDTLIYLSLQKHGIEEFGKDLEKNVMDFFSEFGVKIEKYFSMLSAEELKKEKLYDWYNSQKKVTGFENLMDKFSEFFEYSDEKDD